MCRFTPVPWLRWAPPAEPSGSVHHIETISNRNSYLLLKSIDGSRFRSFHLSPIFCALSKWKWSQILELDGIISQACQDTQEPHICTCSHQVWLIVPRSSPNFWVHRVATISKSFDVLSHFSCESLNRLVWSVLESLSTCKKKWKQWDFLPKRDCIQYITWLWMTSINQVILPQTQFKSAH